jgi:hypothetical protein
MQTTPAPAYEWEHCSPATRFCRPASCAHVLTGGVSCDPVSDQGDTFHVGLRDLSPLCRAALRVRRGLGLVPHAPEQAGEGEAARTHTRTNARTHAHMHARTHAHVHARTHACTHARAQMHARMHACMHAPTRTRTGPFIPPPRSGSVPPRPRCLCLYAVQSVYCAVLSSLCSGSAPSRPRCLCLHRTMKGRLQIPPILPILIIHSLSLSLSLLPPNPHPLVCDRVWTNSAYTAYTDYLNPIYTEETRWEPSP